MRDCDGACSCCGTRCLRADLREAEARILDLDTGLDETYRRLAERALAGVTRDQIEAEVKAKIAAMDRVPTPTEPK